MALVSGTTVGAVALILTALLLPWTDFVDRFTESTNERSVSTDQSSAAPDRDSDNSKTFASEASQADQPGRNATGTSGAAEVVALKPVGGRVNASIAPGSRESLLEELAPLQSDSLAPAISHNSSRLPTPYRRQRIEDGSVAPDRNAQLAKFDLEVGIAVAAQPNHKPVPQPEQIEITSSTGAIEPIRPEATDGDPDESTEDEPVTTPDDRLPSPEFDALVSNAREFAAQRDFQTAVKFYTQAIELKPDEPLPYNLRGIAHVNLKNYEAAIDDYDRAILLAPENAATFNNRGNVFLRMKEYKLARADYTRCLELDPENSVAYDNRGIVHSHLGNYQAAIADHSESIRLNGENASAYHNRGVAYYREGQRSLAEADFAKARELLQESR